MQTVLAGTNTIVVWARHLHRQVGNTVSIHNVPPAAMETQHVTALAVQRPARPPDLLAAEAAIQEEYGWLRTVTTALQRQSIDEWVS